MMKYKKIARTLVLILSVLIMNSYINYNVFANEIISQSSTEVKLQDNFYKYVNQEWIKSSQLKQEEEARSTFTETKEKVNHEVEKIFNDL